MKCKPLRSIQVLFIDSQRTVRRLPRELQLTGTINAEPRDTEVSTLQKNNKTGALAKPIRTVCRLYIDVMFSSRKYSTSRDQCSNYSKCKGERKGACLEGVGPIKAVFLLTCYTEKGSDFRQFTLIVEDECTFNLYKAVRSCIKISEIIPGWDALSQSSAGDAMQRPPGNPYHRPVIRALHEMCFTCCVLRLYELCTSLPWPLVLRAYSSRKRIWFIVRFIELPSESGHIPNSAQQHNNH